MKSLRNAALSDSGDFFTGKSQNSELKSPEYLQFDESPEN